MAICLGTRPTEMHELSLGQFKDVKVEYETVIMYTEHISYTSGAS